MNRPSQKSSQKSKGFFEVMNQRIGDYTIGEEIAHGITHGIGAGFAIAGLTLLIAIGVFRGETRHIVTFSIYGATLVILYLASTLYHALQFKALRHTLKIIDHSGIYLLIAGTYTPVMILGVATPAAYAILTIVWVIAILGIIYKIFFINKFQMASTLSYLAMGWLTIFVWNQLVMQVPQEVITLLIAGGLSYSAGIIFFIWEKLPYNHAVWHLFVLGGSFCHFFAVFKLV